MIAWNEATFSTFAAFILLLNVEIAPHVRCLTSGKIYLITIYWGNFSYTVIQRRIWSTTAIDNTFLLNQFSVVIYKLFITLCIVILLGRQKRVIRCVFIFFILTIFIFSAKFLKA